MEIKGNANRKLILIVITLLLIASNNSIYSKDKDQIPDKFLTSTKLGNDIYFIDTINIINPVLLIDKKSHFWFINSFDVVNLESLSKKDSKYLLSSGWALFFDEWRTYGALNVYYRFLLQFYNNHYYGYGLRHYEDLSLKKYDVATMEPVPSRFFLFMMKGRCIYSRTRELSEEPWGNIKFKDDDAYYPVVTPAYPLDIE